MRRSAMKKYMHAVPILLVGSVLSLAFVLGGSSPRALLVTNSDGPGYESTLAAMESLDWAVDSAQWYEAVEFTAADLTANWDVVWILPPKDDQALWNLSAEGGSLESFVQAGGIVVSVGVSNAQQGGLDIAVGGMDCVVTEDAGETTIAEPDHPIILGPIAGVSNISATDVDPDGTGGGAFLADAPSGETLVHIATNAAGTNVCEYTFGQGRVLISVVDLLESTCLDNILHYVQTLIQ